MKNNQYLKDGGRYRKGEFIRIDVMESKLGWGNEIPTSLSNDNFNYARFKNEKGNVQMKIDQGQCISCHLSKLDSNYLFSLKELREFAKSKY